MGRFKCTRRIIYVVYVFFDKYCHIIMLIAFHKPYLCLSQFTSDGSQNITLAEFNFPSDVYPIGRLDADSEGLLLLTNEKKYIDRLLNPLFRHKRIYWAQVENIPTPESLARLSQGIMIDRYRTMPCYGQILDPQPIIAPRHPPIRVRKHIPDCWIELVLVEGKNRQVRKMTAAIGHPTLRLMRVAVGGLRIGTLKPGEWRILSPEDIRLLMETE